MITVAYFGWWVAGVKGWVAGVKDRHILNIHHQSVEPRAHLQRGGRTYNYSWCGVNIASYLTCHCY